MPKTLQQLADFIATEPDLRALTNETIKYLQSVLPPEGAVVQTILSSKTTLTDAQIKALPTTPVALVPAPDEGKMILFHRASLLFKRTADYTNIGNRSFLYINASDQLGGGVSQKLSDYNRFEITNFLAYGADAIALLPAAAGTPDGFLSYDTFYFIGTGLYLMFQNEGDEGAVGDLTGGDPANTLEVTVFYSIVDLQ